MEHNNLEQVRRNLVQVFLVIFLGNVLQFKNDQICDNTNSNEKDQKDQ